MSIFFHLLGKNGHFRDFYLEMKKNRLFIIKNSNSYYSLIRSSMGRGYDISYILEIVGSNPTTSISFPWMIISYFDANFLVSPFNELTVAKISSFV